MKKFFLILLLALLVRDSLAQQPLPVRPCGSNPVYRFFDFWIGEWEAFGPKGKGGDSKISLILDSCVILEEWTSVAQGYAGKSFNTYNRATQMWQQTWVDNKGGITEYNNSVWEKDKMAITLVTCAICVRSWITQVASNCRSVTFPRTGCIPSASNFTVVNPRDLNHFILAARRFSNSSSNCERDLPLLSWYWANLS